MPCCSEVTAYLKKIICTQVLRIVTEDENSEAGEESQEQDGAKTGVKVVAVQNSCQNTPTYIIIIKISSFLHIYA